MGFWDVVWTSTGLEYQDFLNLTAVVVLSVIAITLFAFARLGMLLSPKKQEGAGASGRGP